MLAKSVRHSLTSLLGLSRRPIQVRLLVWILHCLVVDIDHWKHIGLLGAPLDGLV